VVVGGASLLDLIPPLVLLGLSLALAATLGRRLRALPRPPLAAVCLVGPTLYAVGLLLYLLNDKWKPGMGVAGLGTLAIPAAIAWTLNRGWVAWIAPVLALVTWFMAWILTIPEIRPEAFGPHWPRACYGVFVWAALALAAVGLRGKPSGVDRRIMALSLPFLLLAGTYLLLYGIVPRRPVFSTSIHVCAEILLLMELERAGEQGSAPASSLPTLALHATLLALGGLLLLVLFANLRVFPRSGPAILVATVVATGLSLSYGALRPTLDALFFKALYPEAREAQRRAQELEAELEDARGRLRVAEQLSVVGQLAAQVAHEIKNPLGPIKGYTTIIEREVLVKGALTEKVQRGIQIIREEVETIDARARALLELSQPLEPVLGPADLVELIEATLERVRGESQQIEWAWGSRPAEAPAQVDGPLLRSALLNVLQNAAHAAKARVELALAALPQGGWELCIDDDGPGLPVPVEELFRPFVSHREGGTGLGLVIARGSLRAMGGELELSGRDEGGARARLTFPPQEGAA
jgi:signal transduction histidine kinase